MCVNLSEKFEEDGDIYTYITQVGMTIFFILRAQNRIEIRVFISYGIFVCVKYALLALLDML